MSPALYAFCSRLTVYQLIANFLMGFYGKWSDVWPRTSDGFIFQLLQSRGKCLYSSHQWPLTLHTLGATIKYSTSIQFPFPILDHCFSCQYRTAQKTLRHQYNNVDSRLNDRYISQTSMKSEYVVLSLGEETAVQACSSLGVSQAQKTNVSGDKRSRLRAS